MMIRDCLRVKLSFSEPLVNPFENGALDKKYKLDKLYHYFIGPDDEVEINKA